MAGERDWRGEMFEHSDQIIAMTLPGCVTPSLRRQFSAAVAARIEREDVEFVAQRCEQRAIGQRVEAGGVHEDDVGRRRFGAEGDAGHAPARHLEANAAEL